ncbi:MAG TPA: biotin carboxylase N-terminal domain-containing protein [Candidatus Eisenbacteria bacterium]|nr:biotin carboxylase N-terminal domain-containing protein [Candidatus Eisenbacteria bacterium]
MPKPKTIRRVLIANRGEIAIRVCRTLREMEIESVAVYSEPDRSAPHVYAADQAYLLGPAAAPQSYLNAAKILEVARASGADAIHPGYGFLAESADFAQQVLDAGLVWIGPHPEASRAVGDKVSARALAIRAGVPVLPGTPGPVSDPAELRKAAEAIGYPVVLKAAAGGGGKGMRRVNAPGEFESAVRLAQGEARGAFGDDRLYLERWVERPRHIEVQVLADERGNVLALGERDCSVQRRHQKVIEETPSPALDHPKRRELWELAVKVARAGKYTNAGTAEFLMDAQGRFYFLEMNARLQVEHPVTEMVLGMDLVREQIRVARGEPLDITQVEVKPSGAALEFRIYAEDPDAGWLPQAGTLRRLVLPDGPYVRCDFGVRSGGEIPVHYDPMIGKIIVWGRTRDEAVARARRAIHETVIEGARTTLSFHRWILDQPEFATGNYDTAYLSRHFRAAVPPDPEAEEREAAILAAVFAAAERSAPAAGGAGAAGAGLAAGPAEPASRWRDAVSSLRAVPERSWK